MPIICWGNLAKSADDTLRIEQSISDYVTGHDENVNAHQIPGSALYMHRVNEILDHLDGSVSLRKLLSDQNLFWTVFESLDGWGTDGKQTGTTIFGLQCQTPVAVNGVSTIQTAVAGPESFRWLSHNPFFQTACSISSNSAVVVYIVAGSCYFDGTDTNYGFKILNGNLYALVTLTDGEASTEHTTQITGYDVTDMHVYRWYVDDDANKVYFYVDGNLEHTESVNYPSSDMQEFFTYYVRTTEAVSKRLYSRYLLFQSNR